MIDRTLPRGLCESVVTSPEPTRQKRGLCAVQPSSESAANYAFVLKRLVEHHRGYDVTDSDVERHVECGCLDLEAGLIARELLSAGMTREALLKLVAAPCVDVRAMSASVQHARRAR